MRLLEDIKLTWRVFRCDTNWQANHAFAFLCFAAGFAVATLWTLTQHGFQLEFWVFGAVSVFCVIIWQRLLRSAVWREKVRTTLYDDPDRASQDR